MEQRRSSTITVEKEEVPKRNVRLDENDHHTIVGTVASTAKKVTSQPISETRTRKKRPRIKSKIKY